MVTINIESILRLTEMSVDFDRGWQKRFVDLYRVIIDGNCIVAS